MNISNLSTVIFVMASSCAAVDAESPTERLANILDHVNIALEGSGHEYRVAMADYITNDPNNQGQTVMSKHVGNKQLVTHFVPFDPRRDEWSSDDPLGNLDSITYAIDTTDDAIPLLGGLDQATTDAAIERAVATWNDVECSTLGLTRNPDFGIDIGLVAFLEGLGSGSPVVLADIQHAGFTTDFDFSRGSVIAVAFSFFFTDEYGVPTDIDNDGKIDAAFREIYYDSTWTWKVDGNAIDVEEIALHEMGHGLSQDHFGKVFIDNQGNIKKAPEAVMNSAYTDTALHELQGTDIAGHCSIWANWPNN